MAYYTEEEIRELARQDAKDEWKGAGTYVIKYSDGGQAWEPAYCGTSEELERSLHDAYLGATETHLPYAEEAIEEEKEEGRGMEDFAVERVVYDADFYFSDDGRKSAVEAIAERNKTTVSDVAENYPEDEIDNVCSELRDEDSVLETSRLKAFFGGADGTRKKMNPSWGNHVMVRGTAERWNGSSSEIIAYENFEDSLDCSPNRFGGDNIFADCEIDRICDVNGSLYVSGYHHDGRVAVEMRQLTDAGEEIWGRLDYEGDIDEPIEAMGRTYEYGDEDRLAHDLWENPDMCGKPRFMEKQYGCYAADYEHNGTRIYAKELPENHPARADGYMYEAKKTVNGMDVGVGTFCKGIEEAEAWCRDTAALALGEEKGKEELVVGGLGEPLAEGNGPQLGDGER